VIIDLVRDPILKGNVPTVGAFATAAAVVLVLAGSAIFTLSRLQTRLIFHL
jgi:ABC-type polysaccharide/polyol phosphate export permease